MNTIQQHCIQQLRFEVEFPNKAEVYSFQNQLSDLARNKIDTILDNTFSNCSNDEIVTIDHCEIDLGPIPKDEFNARFLKKLEKSLNDLFSDILGRTTVHRPNVSSITIVNKNQHFIEYFSHYLMYGHLPWNISEKWVSDNFFRQKLKDLLAENNTGLKKIIPLFEKKECRNRFIQIADDQITADLVKQLATPAVFELIAAICNKFSAIVQHASGIDSSAKNILTGLHKGYFLQVLYKIQVLSVAFDQTVAVKEFISFVSDHHKLTPNEWIGPILRETVHPGGQFQEFYKILQTCYVQDLEEKSLLSHDLFSGFNEESFIRWLYVAQPDAADNIVAFIKKTTEKVVTYFPSVQREKISRIIQLQVSGWLSEIRENRLLLSDSSFASITENIEQMFLIPSPPLSVTPVPEPGTSKPFRNKTLMRQQIVAFLKVGIHSFHFSGSTDYLSETILEYASAYPDDFNALIDYEVESSPLVFWRISQVFTTESYKKFTLLLSSGKHKKLSTEPYEKLLLRHFARNGYIPWTVLAWNQEPVYDTLQKFFRQNEASFLSILQEEAAIDVKAEKREEKIGTFLAPLKTGLSGYGEKATIPPGQVKTTQGEWEEKTATGLKAESEKEKSAIPPEQLKITQIRHEEDTPTDVKAESEKEKSAIPPEQLKITQDRHEEGTPTDVRTESEKEKTAIPAEQVKARLPKPGEEEKELKIVDKLYIQLMDFFRGNHPEEFFGFKGYFYTLIQEAAVRMPVETAALLQSLSRADANRLQSVLSVEQRGSIAKFIQKNIQALQIPQGQDMEKQKEIPIDTTVPIYIFNAGLILLNPFLSRLFDKLGLIENKAFKTEEHRQKAMVLLHFLATKQVNPGEHELVLNKVITGAHPSSPVDVKITITQDEKDLCDSLLDAAIQKWAALKNTSRDNLRASFLMREGRLVFEKESWQLSVSQKSYDILIDWLPWGYSVIKYPWMKHSLHTQWRNV